VLERVTPAQVDNPFQYDHVCSAINAQRREVPVVERLIFIVYVIALTTAFAVACIVVLIAPV
jgi:hypothetical protein